MVRVEENKHAETVRYNPGQLISVEEVPDRYVKYFRNRE